MDYSKLFNRALNIIWTYKFLILLGVLAAFSTGTGGDNGTRFEFDGAGQSAPFEGNLPFSGEGRLLQDLLRAVPFLPEQQHVAGVPAAAALLMCLVFVGGIVLYLLGSIARGGLIAGVDAVERGEKTSLSQAWAAGWHRAGTLIGIGILPALPLLASGLLGLAGLVFYNTGAPAWLRPMGVGMAGIVGAVTCLLLPVSLVLGLLRTFANRAAMLEGHGVFAAYARGFNVLLENLGQGAIIFILQIVVTILLAVLLLVPGAIVALCFLLWPLIWLFEGFMAAFFSAVWTLAWRQWTMDVVKV